MNPNPTEPLIDQLRAEAQRFDPTAPTGLRRTVLAAVAHSKPRAVMPVALRWSLAGGGAAAAVVAVACFRYLPNPPSIHDPSHEIVKTSPPNPELIRVAIARLWSRDPLEGEVQSLVTSFNNARDTVTAVLPAAVKRSRPTTQTPADVRPL